ncbi:muscle, skeletal receptor tyrosine protein kinase isoform X2 [Biomphalaria glabrata]|nr:muscle, skeletal receptor tyrosine protein kinase isoform X2 [Biomphalaria glabrata]
MLQSLRWNVCDIITPLLWLMATLGVHCQNGITSTTDSTGQLLLDTTVMADQRKSFFCPQDFEKPIKWFHQIDDGVNSTNLPRLPHNPPERDRSFSQMLPGPSKNFQLIGHRLSFSNVSVRDRGWYYCKDKTGRRSNKFYLFVQKPVDITDPTNISLPIEPGTVSLLCEAAGLPRPFIQWLVNGQPLPPSKFVTINKNIAAVNSSLYNVSKDKPAVYTCKAWNILDKEKEPRIALKTYTFYVAKGSEKVLDTCFCKLNMEIIEPIRAYTREVYNGRLYLASNTLTLDWMLTWAFRESIPALDAMAHSMRNVIDTPRSPSPQKLVSQDIACGINDPTVWKTKMEARLSTKSVVFNIVPVLEIVSMSERLTSGVMSF